MKKLLKNFIILIISILCITCSWFSLIVLLDLQYYPILLNNMLSS